MQTADLIERTPRLHLRISPTAEWKLRAGHPWLFSDSILSQNREGEAGELAIIYDRHDNFLALGLFDPQSPIRARILCQGKPQPIDETWWRSRLEQTLNRRRNLFDAHTTGFRWIHGESDGWPALVLDRYDTTLALKLYSLAWVPRLPHLIGLMRQALQPERIVLRLSRNLQSPARAEFKKSDGDILHGPALDGPVVFLESGLRFEADVLRGQKTGFFLDQRENRRRVESLARGKKVLNAFSFSGGFSVYAARGGAVSVTDLDISAHALAGANRNFALNQADAAVARCRHDTLQADAFEWLESADRARFGLIILDPPSLAKREVERARAIQAYGKLARGALARLEPEGVLVACSCSAHVTAPEFYGAIRQAAQASGRRFEELQTTGHPPDHPATFAEAQYLKSIYLRVG